MSRAGSEERSASPSVQMDEEGTLKTVKELCELFTRQPIDADYFQSIQRLQIKETVPPGEFPIQRAIELLKTHHVLFPNLMELDLSETQLRDSDVETIVRLPHLESLYLGNCGSLTSKALTFFERAPLLQLLDLTEVSIERADILKWVETSQALNDELEVCVSSEKDQEKEEFEVNTVKDWRLLFQEEMREEVESIESDQTLPDSTCDQDEGPFVKRARREAREVNRAPYM